MTAFYNDTDPFATEWLVNLMRAGHVSPGTVECRSIADVMPEHVLPHERCHFFAGIGGWELALRLAGWPDHAPVWTGSCPCQPFSQAGRKKGTADERHLWPEFFRLIRKCRPPVIFGEQVASPAGRAWLDAVLADLEGVGFAVGAADLCAAGVGAPHIRQRLYWVAVADGERREGLRLQLRQRRPRQAVPQARGMGQPNGGRCPTRQFHHSSADQKEQSRRTASHTSQTRGVADAALGGRREGRAAEREQARANGTRPPDRRSPWSDVEWLPCADGTFRPTQPGLQPLANGVPARMGKLRAYGNAVVPELAATFIRAVMACL